MSRRSVRKFKSDAVPKEKIVKYLEAANMAPTASNQQPWNFVIIYRKHLDKIQDLLEESFIERTKYAKKEDFAKKLEDLPIPTEKDGDKAKGLQKFFKRMGNAPAALLVHIPRSDDSYQDFINVQDGAAAIENFILAAWDDNVGSCWMCGPLMKKSEALKEYFQIPEDRQVVAIIPFGYPESVPKSPPKEDVEKKTIWFE